MVVVKATINIPRQTKYTLVSSVFRYHLLRFLRPASMDGEMLPNLDEVAISPQVSCKNSSTGMVRQTVGCEDVENDCWALAGSCRLIKRNNKR